MEINNEQLDVAKLPLLEGEEQETEGQEPDLDNTTFFPANEYLDGKELSFAQKVDRVNVLLLRNTLYRRVLYRILATLKASPLPFNELEALIQDMPEYVSVAQPPSGLIDWLEKAEAAAVVAVDEAGNPLTEEACEGKTEDEIDDMTFDFIVEITEFGTIALENFDPESLLFDLLNDKPQRYSTYIDLLNFLKEKRAYIEIDEYLRGNPILMDGLAPSERPMQPSVFVDKLASAGAILYDGGWQITSEGLSYLESNPAS